MAFMEFVTPKGPMILDGDGASTFRALVDAAMLHFGEHADTKTLRRHLMRWLMEHAGVECKSPSWVEALYDHLGKITAEQTIMIPVEGILLEGTFPIGRIELRQMAQTDVDRLTGQHGPIRETLNGKISGKVVAVFSTIATPAQAHARAVQYVDEALNVLRFAYPESSTIHRRRYFGRSGEVVQGQHWYLQLSDGHGPRLSESMDPNALPVPLDAWRKAHVTEFLRPAAAWLRNPERSDLQEALVRAICLYGKGLTLPDHGDRLLHAVMAAETFFVRGYEDLIKRRLMKRVAASFYVLKDLVPDYAGLMPHPEEVALSVGIGYNIRSKLVHEGRHVDQDVLGSADKAMSTIWTALGLAVSIQDEIGREDYINRLERVADEIGLTEERIEELLKKLDGSAYRPRNRQKGAKHHRAK